MNDELLGYAEFDQTHINNPECLIESIREAIDVIAFVPEGYHVRLEYRLIKDYPLTQN